MTFVTCPPAVVNLYFLYARTSNEVEYRMPQQKELRLFPLGLVLFPGASLPLRIFEDRYKVMIGECLDEDKEFGVLLIKEGVEVGGPAQPYSVGTTARILSAQRLDRGRYNLQTQGEKRFRLLEITQEVPFLMGKVEFLPEEPLQDPGIILEEATQLLGEYWKILTSLEGSWIKDLDIPDDPVSLSFAIAQVVSSPPRVGQFLLQMDSAGERIIRALPLLKERLQVAKKALEGKSLSDGRLN